MTRDEARAYVREEAEQAGVFNDDTIAAVVDAAMSAFDDLGHDDEQFCDMVDAVIQGHANP